MGCSRYLELLMIAKNIFELFESLMSLQILHWKILHFRCRHVKIAVLVLFIINGKDAAFFSIANILIPIMNVI